MDSLFRCHTCNHCGGNWVLIEDYVAWRERNPDYSFELVDVENLDKHESSKAMLCPVTGSIMSKYRILSTSPHRLDYSSHVGGVWLDKGEWDLLKSEGLACCLNVLITEPWQQKIRADQARISFTNLYQSRLGEADYNKAREIREWLKNHPKKAELRAYLLSADPYTANR